MKKGLVVTVAATAATLTFAASVTDAFDVTANVTSACSVVAGDLNFGTYTGSQLDGSSDVNVTCTLLTPYTVKLDTGLSGDYAQRYMDGDTNTSQHLNYNLYTDITRATTWGDGTGGTGTATGLGLGVTALTHTVYGRIPASENVQPDTYRDTITATVEY